MDQERIEMNREHWQTISYKVGMDVSELNKLLADTMWEPFAVTTKGDWQYVWLRKLELVIGKREPMFVPSQSEPDVIDNPSITERLDALEAGFQFVCRPQSSAEGS